MTSFDQFRTTFFQECDELLGTLEQQLSILDTAPDQKERVDAAFRCVHSIKGGAAMFGFGRLTDFAHQFESALDSLRSGRTSVCADLGNRLLRAADILSDLAEEVRAGAILPSQHEHASLADLKTIATAKNETVPNTLAIVKKEIEQHQAGFCTYRINLTPNPAAFKQGTEPLALIRKLASLGNLTTEADATVLPALASMDPGVLYLSWVFTLDTNIAESEIRSAFDFYVNGANLVIARIGDPADEAKTVEPDKDAAQSGSLTDTNAPIRDRRVSSIRVDLDRVDKLVDLVSEVVVAQSAVLQIVSKSQAGTDPHLMQSLGQLQHLIQGLQDSVMSIRAQPIRSIFGRMPRVVRDVAEATGRLVRLETSGEETEIDKTIVEKLSDPLIHIVRNAVHHGVEAPEQRLLAGKPETGTVRLSASHQNGNITIEVSDDGAGIDRDAVLAQAVKRGLVASDAVLTDREIENLIFSPGLSTAQSVTGISGRGVGMDVVRRNILAIGGHISIRSVNGQGTKTTIVLPLTLAVMDGMLVNSAAEQYVIPLSSVVECFVAPRSALIDIPGSGKVVSIRNRHIPVIELNEQFGNGLGKQGDILQVTVVESSLGQLTGIAVDEIQGSQQIVVKSIRDTCGSIAGIAGASILGDGSIALILDINGLTGTAANAFRQTKASKHLTTLSGDFAA